MSKSTFGQALQALNLIHAKDPSSERLTALYNSGLLSDLLDADPAKINREAFRASLSGGDRARSTAAKKTLLAKAAVARILEPVTTVEVAGCEIFKAKDKFREGKKTDGVKIAWIGSNFQNNFADKVEEPVKPATLKISKLTKASVDTPILAELGADYAETTLAQFWELLKKQGRGQSGDLLVNGWANIAYIRDQNGTLWAVLARWDAGNDGWSVEALSVSGPDTWDAGRQVVSR